MKKLHYCLAIIALLATLCVFSVQEVGSALMAKGVSSQHTSSVASPASVNKTSPKLIKLAYPCPGGGSSDC